VTSALDIRHVVERSDPRSEALERVVSDLLEGVLTLSDLPRYAERIARRATQILHTEYPDQTPIEPPEVVAYLDTIETDADEIEGADPNPETRDALILLEEWDALTTETDRNPRAPLLVREVDQNAVSGESPLSIYFDGIFLVDRLREVRVLEGFQRLDTTGKMVFPNLGTERPTWLPATEVFGEGIFLQFGEQALSRWQDSQMEALLRRLRPIEHGLGETDAFNKRFAVRVPLLARFMVVHTFAHLMIRQLCYECGYSGASLRERLYVFPERAGVLIYTADGDSEGSLGGLVRQGEPDRLHDTVRAALQRAEWCSNDHICSELPNHGPSRTNRAACHACVLVSETSCTEMNGLLDRRLVIGDREAEADVQGLFHGIVG